MSALDENLKPPSFHAWLASLAFGALMLLNLFLQQGDNPYLRGAGVAVLILAGVLIFAPFFLLRKHGRTRDGRTYIQTVTVVDQGLYAIIRHPQYLGFLLITLGMNVLWVTFSTLALWPILALLYYRLAKEEDKQIEQKFGKQYTEYKKEVPMFIPKIRTK